MCGGLCRHWEGEWVPRGAEQRLETASRAKGLQSKLAGMELVPA